MTCKNFQANYQNLWLSHQSHWCWRFGDWTSSDHC